MKAMNHYHLIFRVLQLEPSSMLSSLKWLRRRDWKGRQGWFRWNLSKNFSVCIASGLFIIHPKTSKTQVIFLKLLNNVFFVGITGNLCLAGFPLHARDGGGGVVLRGCASLAHSLLHRRPYHLQKHLHPCVHHMLARSGHDITWVVGK